ALACVPAPPTADGCEIFGQPRICAQKLKPCVRWRVESWPGGDGGRKNRVSSVMEPTAWRPAVSDWSMPPFLGHQNTAPVGKAGAEAFTGSGYFLPASCRKHVTSI